MSLRRKELEPMGLQSRRKLAGMRAYEGEMVCEFESLTQMNLFRNGTENALVLTIDAGSAAKCGP